MKPLSRTHRFLPILLLAIAALLSFPRSASMQGEGQRCGAFGRCDNGLTCNLNVRCERPPPSAGAENGACRLSSSPCDDGLTCLGVICKRLPAPGSEGGLCLSGSSCNAGLECVGGFCAPHGGRNQPCRADRSCDGGLSCVLLVCVDAGNFGQPCLPGNTCNGGLECVNGSCATSLPRGGAGQPCRPGSVCDAGLRCIAGTGCVFAGGVAQPCRPDGTCNANLACVQSRVNDVVVDSCVLAGGPLQPCLAGGRCNNDLICEEGRVCVLPPPVGGIWQPCRPDGTCNSGLQCRNFMCSAGPLELLELSPYLAREDLISRSGSFDYQKHRAAVESAARLPAAPLRSSAITVGTPGSVSSALTAAPTWEFVGPTNLSLPGPINPGYGPVAGRVNAIAYSPSDPQVIFAGSVAGGLFRSDDGGDNWKPLSDGISVTPTNASPVWPDLHISSIAVDPKDTNNLYVGLGDFPMDLLVAGGIMRSRDGGVTWSRQGSPQLDNSLINTILVDPDDPKVLIATAGRPGKDGEVWRSDNAGDTWTSVVANQATWTGAMGAKPQSGERTYYAAGVLPPAATGGPRRATFLRSRDRGLTWETRTAPTSVPETTFLLATSSKNPDTVYGLLPGNGAGAGSIWKSDDQGNSWKSITTGFPNDGPRGINDNWSNGTYNAFIACTNRDGRDIVYVGLIKVAVSNDGGATWDAQLGFPTLSSRPITHDDQHALAFHPTDSNEFLLANDGGVYRGKFDTNSKATSFQSLNRRLPITQFYHAAFHPDDPNVMLGGAQDNQTAVSYGDLNNWVLQGAGDGGGVAISQVRPNIQYATVQGTLIGGTLPIFGFFRTDSGWRTFDTPLGAGNAPQQAIPPFTGGDNLAFTPAITIDPSRSTVVYTGTQALWRLDDEFPLTPFRWKKVSNASLATSAVITQIAVAPSNRDTIYTTHLDGSVWVSFDRGENWKKLNVLGAGPPCGARPDGTLGCPRSANAISINPNDPNDVLVGFDNKGSGGLFRITGTDTATPTWTMLSGSPAQPLPFQAVQAIARDPDRPETSFFVGTDIGVYMTDDIGANWFNAGWPLGLPPLVPVRNLTVVPKTRLLNAATFGRGMWRLALPEDRPAISGFLVTPLTVSGQDLVGLVSLVRTAPPPGVPVTFTSSDPSVIPAPAPVRVQGLKSDLQVLIPTRPTLTETRVTLTATIENTSKSVEVIVPRIEVKSLSVQPSTVRGSENATFTIELNGYPPPGTTVAVRSDCLAVPVPSSVPVPAGQVSATFGVSTSSPGQTVICTISATLGNTTSVQLTVRSPELSAFAMLAPEVKRGRRVRGFVELDAPAPPGGQVVRLKSSSWFLVVPREVVVPAGQRRAEFTARARWFVLNRNVTLSAWIGDRTPQTNVLTTMIRVRW